MTRRKEEFDKKISELFYEIDSDHNGNISKEEMQKQLMKLGLNSNFVKEVRTGCESQKHVENMWVCGSVIA